MGKIIKGLEKFNDLVDMKKVMKPNAGQIEDGCCE